MPESDRNWKMDHRGFAEVYTHPACPNCKQPFLGPKRAPLCRVCHIEEEHRIKSIEISVIPSESANLQLKRAITIHGESAQIKMIQEEAQELGLAITKYLRALEHGSAGDEQKRKADVIDELADMKVMLAQACLIFHEPDIDERVRYKLERLSKRLDKKSFEGE